MISTRLKLTALALVIASGLVGGSSLILGLCWGQSPSPASPVEPDDSAKRSTPVTFLVWESTGLAYLDAEGKEMESLRNSFRGAASPDGKWIAAIRHESREKAILIIQPVRQPGDSIKVELVFNGLGEVLPVWSADGKRVFIGESHSESEDNWKYAFRVYNLATKNASEVKVPDGYWVTDWSKDGKKFLARQLKNGATRLAWLNADGSGEPEFLTGEDEIATDGRLSPDGTQVLFRGGATESDGEKPYWRLIVMNLNSKKKTILNKPGEMNGYCWSPDGSHVAYTWQKWLDKPEEVIEREILLITCDTNGQNRKTVTSRKHKFEKPSRVGTPPGAVWSGYMIFFEVIDWR